MENQVLMNYGQAIEAMQNGKPVARLGWNGKRMFVFMQIPSEIGIEIIPKMQSLPQLVKEEFEKRGLGISYSNQFAIVNQKNEINGWVASSSDTLATDWILYDSSEGNVFYDKQNSQVIDGDGEVMYSKSE